jgi:hypothetical protein
MNLEVALGETRGALNGIHRIHVLVTPDCLDSWEMQR